MTTEQLSEIIKEATGNPDISTNAGFWLDTETEKKPALRFQFTVFACDKPGGPEYAVKLFLVNPKPWSRFPDGTLSLYSNTLEPKDLEYISMLSKIRRGLEDSRLWFTPQERRYLKLDLITVLKDSLNPVWLKKQSPARAKEACSLFADAFGWLDSLDAEDTSEHMEYNFNNLVCRVHSGLVETTRKSVPLSSYHVHITEKQKKPEIILKNQFLSYSGTEAATLEISVRDPYPECVIPWENVCLEGNREFDTNAVMEEIRNIAPEGFRLTFWGSDTMPDFIKNEIIKIKDAYPEWAEKALAWAEQAKRTPKK